MTTKIKTYEITETGLVAHGGWTPELWEAAGLEIARYQKGLMWLIGDWLNAGDSEGYVQRGKLAEACERFGIAYGTAKNAACVASAFPKRSSRNDLLDFSHHQAVANHDQATELLAWAATNGSTAKELREEKQRRSNVTGAPTPDAPVKPAARQTVDEDIEPNQMLDEISYYALAFLDACPERVDELEGLLLTWVSRCKQR